MTKKGIKETMTVQKALEQATLIDKKINDSIRLLDTSNVKKASEDTIRLTKMKVGEYIDRANADMQSIEDLFMRRRALRAALHKSNANTQVVIGGETYSVAEAIEMRKTGIGLQEEYYRKLASNRASAASAVSQSEEKVTRVADEMVAKAFTENKSSKEAMALHEGYVSMNKLELIEPKGIDDKMRAIVDSINNFMADVNVAITASNATTVIEFEY
ncbi:MAG: hypothetical protein ACOYI8_09415 [Christensenellales bacterium]|jgi:hypothetical protein